MKEFDPLNRITKSGKEFAAGTANDYVSTDGFWCKLDEATRIMTAKCIFCQKEFSGKYEPETEEGELIAMAYADWCREHRRNCKNLTV